MYHVIYFAATCRHRQIGPAVCVCVALWGGGGRRGYQDVNRLSGISKVMGTGYAYHAMHAFMARRICISTCTHVYGQEALYSSAYVVAC